MENLGLEGLKVFLAAKVREFMNLNRGDPLLLADANSSLLSIFNFLASGLSHRAVVHIGKNYAILSQLDVTVWFVQLIGDMKIAMPKVSMEFRTEVKQKLESTPLWQALQEQSQKHLNLKVLASARTSNSVLEVMKKMFENSASAIAVVDAKDFFQGGPLVGEFSYEHLMCIENLSCGAHGISDLNLPVMEFLRIIGRGLAPITLDIGKFPYNPKQGMSLADALKVLSEKRSSRIWITADGSPIGVVSLTDLLRLIQSVLST
jgi:CBS domain-containing protein